MTLDRVVLVMEQRSIRLLIGTLALTTVALGADTKKKAVPAKPSKAAVAKPAPAVTIPADAERISEQTYRKREANGKVYLYTKTPFGVARMEESAMPQSAAPAAKAEAPVKVVEDGENVRFERKGPFGKNVWTRKKTELNTEERGLVEKSRMAQK